MQTDFIEQPTRQIIIMMVITFIKWKCKICLELSKLQTEPPADKQHQQAF